MPEQRILMGVVGRPHGVRGLVRVVSYTAEAASLSAYGPLSDAKGRRFVLRWKGEGIAELAALGPDGRAVPLPDRTAAEALTNTRLYIDRRELPPPEENEYYLADLIGMDAEDAEGRPIGTVESVHDYGGGVSLEIAGPSGGPLVVPFTRAYVPAVDLAAGRVTVIPPAETIVPQAAPR